MVSASTIYIPQDYPTIMQGLYAASSGDSILVAPGTYDGFMWSGIALQDMTIQGSGEWGVNATKLYGDVSVAGINLDDIINWEIAGFEIYNFTTGISVEHSQDVEFHHNYIHHNPYTHAYGIVMEFNTDIYAHHNIIAYNHYVGVRIHDGNENVRFYNNTIVYTEGFHGFLIMEYTPGLEITNNIIAFNSSDGIQFAPGSSQGDAVLDYNDNYGNGNNWYNCNPGIGNISSNPQFTNNPAMPYTLNSTSPCIDTGDPDFPLDPDGTRADIGALFYDQRPPPIEELTVEIYGQDIRLEWEDAAGRLYRIYRAEEPIFEITGMAPIDSTNNTFYVDSSAVDSGQYFYIVTTDN